MMLANRKIIWHRVRQHHSIWCKWVCDVDANIDASPVVMGLEWERDARTRTAHANNHTIIIIIIIINQSPRAIR